MGFIHNFTHRLLPVHICGSFSCIAVGKWHAGFSTPSRTPKGRGFDTSLGYLFAFNDYLHGFANENCADTPFDTQPGRDIATSDPVNGSALCTAKSLNARGIHHYTDLWESGDMSEGPAYGVNGSGYEEAIFSSRVMALIEGHDGGDVDHPLFVYYAMHLLHSPLCVPQDFYDKFAFINDSEDRRFVAAMIHYMDNVIGEVVDALHMNGLWENTLLVWSSDNGAAIEETTGAKNAYPLKGGYYTNCMYGVCVCVCE